jgi:ubiquinone/menaquinone biosynthesis C-methylase UbiE
VIALAQKWPRAKILATDISPAMVAILNRRIGERGLSDRVTAVVMDATRVEIEPDAFDFIAGSSMLHHLLDPFPVLDQLLAGLQTGGAALFFEPFQPGNFVLRQALQELSRRNATAPEPFSDDVIEFFRVLVLGMDIVSSDKRDHPILPNLDDKWLFTKSQFEAAAERAGARLKIRATYVRNGAFRTKVVDLLKSGRGIEAPLPAWADEILRDYDSNVSPALREDLLMEGSIVFVK